MSKYKGKVLVITNVACKWGLTPQNYKEFVELYSKYKSEGFEVLAFPSNSFFQEPGSNDDIKQFVGSYNVEFPIFDKVDVNGKNTLPMFEFLKRELPDSLLGLKTEAIKWNFTKFLINRNGVPVKRFGPKESPFSFEQEIVDELKKN